MITYLFGSTQGLLHVVQTGAKMQRCKIRGREYLLLYLTEMMRDQKTAFLKEKIALLVAQTRIILW